MTEKVEILKEKVEDYISDLILNSKTEEWNKSLLKDDIIILIYSKNFNVRFKNTNGFTRYEFDIEPYKIKISNLFNKKIREKNKKLRIKHREIVYYIENKSDLEILNNIVNNFPIRIQRKDKLEKLNSNKK